MNRRVEVIKIELAKRNIEGMIVNNPKNVSFIVGFDIEGTILICPSSTYLIIDSELLDEVNSKLLIDDEITVIEKSMLSDSDYLDFFSTASRVGFEENYITYAGYTKMLRRYRIKEPIETESLIEKIIETRKDLQ